MLLGEFAGRVKNAAVRLCELYPNGNPPDEQIFAIALEAGLPIVFRQSNYKLDPSTAAVYYVAYEGEEREELKKFYTQMKGCLTKRR